jgi:peptide/nickel transport system permease protein
MLVGSRSLRNFILARILLTIPMIWILVTVVFLFMRVLPGDPIRSRMKPGTDPEKIAQIRESLGLNDPIHIQYVNYLNDLLHGDFGVSIVGEERPVAEKISERLPATLELVIPASILTLLFGVASGAFAADEHKRAPDVTIRLGAVFIYSIPIFWMGLLLQMIFSLKLGWLPVAGRIDPKIDLPLYTNMYLFDAIFTDNGWATLMILLLLFGGIPLNIITGKIVANQGGTEQQEKNARRIHILTVLVITALVAVFGLNPNWKAAGSVSKHMVLPVITLSLALVGVFVRLTRSNMIETLQQDFIMASRARGVPDNKVVYFHALRNTFIPILTLVGLQIAILFAGAVLTETTFSWPGMGLMLREGIGLRDYPLVQGGVTVFAVLIAMTTMLMDILYAFVDPRIRY